MFSASVKNTVLLKPATKFERKLPVNIQADDLSFYEPVRSYKTADCYLKSVNDASVTFDSIIYQGFSLVDESLYLNEHHLNEGRSYYRFRYALKKFLTCQKVCLDKAKNYLVATNTESTGHFHWFTEVLPKLMCVGERAKEFILLLPDKPYIRKIALESLKLLRLDFEDIILMKETELYQAKNLSFVSRICRTGQMHDELMRKINSLFTAGKVPGNRKIYVSREKAGFRKIVNEKEFAAMLQSNGFDILHSEDLTLAEQTEIFSSCQTLLGIHGAGLTNVLLMPPESNLIELRKNEINVGYWFLADSSNHNYYYYNGIPDSEKTIVGRGCNLTIPLKDFEEKILARL